MTYLTSVTQFETRHRQIEAELGRERAAAASRRVERPRRTSRLAQGRPGRRRSLGRRASRRRLRRPCASAHGAP